MHSNHSEIAMYHANSSYFFLPKIDGYINTIKYEIKEIIRVNSFKNLKKRLWEYIAIKFLKHYFFKYSNKYNLKIDRGNDNL